MEEVKKVFDPETGVTFEYSWGSFGWNLTIGDWFREVERDDRRNLMKCASLLWPEVPVELKAQVELENRKLQSLIKGTPWPKEDE